MIQKRKQGSCFLFVFSMFLAVAAGAQDDVRTDSEVIEVTHDRIHVQIVERGVGESCRMEVQHPASLSTRSLRLANHERLVVDLKGVVLPRGRVVRVKDSSCVSAVRFGIQPKASRIVFDLFDTIPKKYALTPRDKSFSLVIGGDSESAPLDEVSDRGSAVKDAKEIPAPQSTDEVVSQVATLETEKAQSVVATDEKMNRMETTTVIDSELPIPRVAELTDEMDEHLTGVEAPFALDTPVIEFSRGDRRVANVTISNTSQVPLTFSTGSFRIRDPGLSSEERVADSKMLVSPKMFSLEPGTHRQVRVVLTGPPSAAEDVFHVVVTALEGFENIKVALDREEWAEGAIQGRATVLVLASRTDTLPEMTVRNDDSGAVIGNSGKKSFLLDGISICPLDGKCTTIASQRLFPRMEVQFDVPEKGYLQFLKVAGTNVQPHRIEVPLENIEGKE